MPAPIAAISDWISVLATTLSIDARSTLRILPRSGRIACVFGSRASRAEPPAESPSTMNSSVSSRLRAAQSASLSGMPTPSSAVLRRVSSRACFAALRARAAFDALATIAFAGFGCSSSQRPKCSLVVRSTSERISVFPSFAFVCPSNCGSASRTDTIAVRPSRTSSPWKRRPSPSRRLRAFAYRLIACVSARLKPSACIPPSVVEMPLA